MRHLTDQSTFSEVMEAVLALNHTLSLCRMEGRIGYIVSYHKTSPETGSDTLNVKFIEDFNLIPYLNREMEAQRPIPASKPPHDNPQPSQIPSP